jgi:hypothetical protein
MRLALFDIRQPDMNGNQLRRYVLRVGVVFLECVGTVVIGFGSSILRTLMRIGRHPDQELTEVGTGAGIRQGMLQTVQRVGQELVTPLPVFDDLGICREGVGQ